MAAPALAVRVRRRGEWVAGLSTLALLVGLALLSDLTQQFWRSVSLPVFLVHDSYIFVTVIALAKLLGIPSLLSALLMLGERDAT